MSRISKPLIPTALAALTVFGTGPAHAQFVQVASRAEAQVTMYGPGDTRMRTMGYESFGDGGGATYVKAGTGTPPNTASFNDQAGNLWIYVPDSFGINVRQFGAKCNWNIGNVTSPNYATFDAAAHDDTAAFQSAIDFARIKHGEDDRGGGGGRVVYVPSGSCMITSTVRVKDQVTLKGEGPYSTVLVMNQGFPTSANFVELGDAAGVGQYPAASFASRIEDLQLWSVNADGASGTSMLHSNNAQHTGGAARVKIFAGNRGAADFELGYGGASYVTIEDVEAYNFGDRHPVSGSAIANPHPIVRLSYGAGTFISAHRLVLQGPNNGGESYVPYSSGAEALRIEPTTVGLGQVGGGQIQIDGFHTEGVRNGIVIATAPGGGMTRLRNLTGGNGCTDLVVIAPNVDVQTTVVGMATRNGCSGATVRDLRSGGTSVTTAIVPDTVF